MLHLQHLQNLCKTHLSNEKLIFIQVKKNCYQDYQSLACLQFNKYNCLNILADDILLISK